MSFVLGFAVLFAAMGGEFAGGRRFGALDVLLFPFELWYDVTQWSSGARTERIVATEATPRRNRAAAAVATGGSRLLDLAVRVVVLVVAAALLVWGVSSASYALRHRTPTRISLAEFARTHPTDGWFSIADASVDYARSARLSGTYHAGESFYPIVARDHDAAHISAFVDDKNEAGLTTRVPGPVTGVVMSAQENEDVANQRADLKSFGSAVDPAYRILRIGYHPQTLLALAAIAGGLLLAALVVGPLVRRLAT